MKLSLPARIFFLQVVFVAGMVATVVYFADSWNKDLSDFDERLQQEFATLGEEREFGPALNWVGRALFLQLEDSIEEARDKNQEVISEALGSVVASIEGVESILMVDRDHRIRLSSEPELVGQGYSGSEYKSRFATPAPFKLAVENPDSGDDQRKNDYFVPIFDREYRKEGGEQTRLGTLIVRYRTDELFREQLDTPLLLPKIPPLTREVSVLIAVGLGVGLLIAVLTGLPARRLERALAEFKARDFKGGFRPEKAGKDLEPAVEAISELGGRLEALDAQRREREALLATLSQSLEEGMIALDPTGAPVAWNPAALRIFGAPSVKEDRSPEEASSLEAWQIEEGLKTNPTLVTRREGEALVGSQEVDLVRHGGESSPARVTRVPFEMRPGEEGTLLLLGDLATLRKVQTHLLEAGRFAVLAHLAAGLAHEIRNPLHSIQINASVVEQYLSAPRMDSGAVNESLSTIKNETHRLADLLNNYLGMVRPEKETALVDLRELCRRVIQLVGYSARKAQIRIRLEGEEKPPLVPGVPDRLQQAILNLVLNAIQAMTDGGALSLAVTHAQGHVRVTVSDTGPGISADVASELFEAGVTTRPGGTGLGLSLVRLIAESHGGSVTYRSTPGRGASFVVDLPAEDGE